MVGHRDTGEFSLWNPPPQPYLCAYVILKKCDTLLGGAAFSQIYEVQLQLIDRLEINVNVRFTIPEFTLILWSHYFV